MYIVLGIIKWTFIALIEFVICFFALVLLVSSASADDYRQRLQVQRVINAIEYQPADLSDFWVIDHQHTRKCMTTEQYCSLSVDMRFKGTCTYTCSTHSNAVRFTSWVITEEKAGR